MELPPREYFPDYYQIIKKPLAFTDIKAKLDRGEYTTLKSVHDDFHQMFINAKRYNQSGSDIFNYAKRLDVSRRIVVCEIILTGAHRSASSRLRTLR